MKATKKTFAIKPVKSLDDLVIHNLPSGRALNVVKVSGTSVFIGQNGSVYANFRWTGPYWSIRGLSGVTNLIKGLARIGVITQAQLDEHISWSDDRERRSTICWRSASLLTDAKIIGLKLTPTQRRILKRNTRKESV